MHSLRMLMLLMLVSNPFTTYFPGLKPSLQHAAVCQGLGDDSLKSADVASIGNHTTNQQEGMSGTNESVWLIFKIIKKTLF